MKQTFAAHSFRSWSFRHGMGTGLGVVTELPPATSGDVIGAIPGTMGRVIRSHNLGRIFSPVLGTTGRVVRNREQ